MDMIISKQHQEKYEVCESSSESRTETLERIGELYDKTQQLDAYHLAMTLGPLQEWRGSEERVLSSQLALSLGAPRLGVALALRGLRELPQQQTPHHWQLRNRYALSLFAFRGPFAAWEAMQKMGSPDEDESPQIQAEWRALQGHIAGMFRDFETADRVLSLAEKLAPDDYWVTVNRAATLKYEDRYEEALEVAERAIELCPWSPVCILNYTDNLLSLGRDDDALEQLTVANQQLQSGAIAQKLGELQLDLQMVQAGRESLKRAAEFYPLAEKKLRERLAKWRSNAAYYCGDFIEAAEFSEQIEKESWKEYSQRLRKATGDESRVLLPVSFVRQHYATCVPAALAVITQYLKKPADHLQLAEEICYDGTNPYDARCWAEKNDWIVREFSVTFESARDLIDRGIPFSMCTPYMGGGHAQAVMGYDSLRRSLLIRDPYYRVFEDTFFDESLEVNQGGELHGIVLIPNSEVDQLEGLKLPNSEYYDELHSINGLLEVHDFEGAKQVYHGLRKRAPEHWITGRAMLLFGSYEWNWKKYMSGLNQLLQHFPEDLQLQVMKLNSLRQLGQQRQSLKMLEEITSDKKCDPHFKLEYALELLKRKKQLPQATRLVRQAICDGRHHRISFHILAEIYSQREDHHLACELYRLASCLEDKNEKNAYSYFTTAQTLAQTEEALHYLKARVEKLESKSSSPAQTLCWALGKLDREEEGFEVLRQSQQLHPEDGTLMLYHADTCIRYGRAKEAQQLLSDAKGKCARVEWENTSFNLFRHRYIWYFLLVFGTVCTVYAASNYFLDTPNLLSYLGFVSIQFFPYLALKRQLPALKHCSRTCYGMIIAYALFSILILVAVLMY